ncbi:MAG: hypothetical protein KC547_10220 [Anaerolineae bacterium]|nr:hypothetical protein [Anaerolineae bacterium]
MTDQPVNQPAAEDAQIVEPAPQEAQEEKHFEPRGAFAFVLLMLLFYVLYYAFMYYQVFVGRLGN